MSLVRNAVTNRWTSPLSADPAASFLLLDYNPATVTGPVASWAPSTGVGTVVQAVVSQRPAKTAANASFNSLPTIDFVAASSQALVGAFTLANPVEVFTVGKWNGAFSAAACMIDGNTANVLRTERSAASSVFSFNSSLSSTATTTPTAAHVYSLSVDKRRTEARIDGVRTGIGLSADQANSPNGLSFGAIQGVSNFADCSIARVRVYRILPPTVRALLDAWLRTVYGTP